MRSESQATGEAENREQCSKAAHKEYQATRTPHSGIQTNGKRSVAEHEDGRSIRMQGLGYEAIQLQSLHCGRCGPGGEVAVM